MLVKHPDNDFHFNINQIISITEYPLSNTEFNSQIVLSDGTMIKTSLKPEELSKYINGFLK